MRYDDVAYDRERNCDWRPSPRLDRPRVRPRFEFLAWFARLFCPMAAVSRRPVAR